MAKLKGGRRKEPPFTHIFLFLSFQCPEKGRGESKIIRPSSVVVVKNGSTLFLSCFVIPKPPDTIFLSTLSEDGCSFSNCCISSLTQGSHLPFTLPLLSFSSPWCRHPLPVWDVRWGKLLFPPPNLRYHLSRQRTALLQGLLWNLAIFLSIHHPPLSSAWWFHTHPSLHFLHQLLGSKTQNFLRQTQHFFHLQTFPLSTSFIALLPCLQTSSVFLLTFSFIYTSNTYLLSASHVPGTRGYPGEKCRHGLLLSQNV